jgi:hypothetical protein
MALDRVDIYGSTTDTFASASVVTQGTYRATHPNAGDEKTWYYWAIPYDKLGGEGTRYPSGATGGVSCKSYGQAGTALALTNGKLVVTQNSPSANQLKIEVKTASGNDPSASDPIDVAFINTLGAYSSSAITAALSLTIPNGNTLGTVSNLPARVWVLLFNDSGTLRLAVTRRFDGSVIYPLVDFGWATATSEADVGAGNMDSAGIIYASTAVLSSPYRVIGYFQLGSSFTAGQWDFALGNKVLAGSGTPMPGDVLQTKTRIDKTVTTGTTTIPFDDTIPQSTEGVEVVNATGVSPQDTVNAAELEISANVAYSVAANLTLSVFSDATPNALASSFGYVPAADAPLDMYLKHIKSIESGSFSWRIGGSTAGTLTVNGVAGARKLGATLATTAFLREIQV